MELLRVLWEDLRAWRRGERRVVSRRDVNGRVIRGRVYARRNEATGGAMPVKTRLVGRMSLRVYRKAADTWEDPVDMGPIYKEKR